MYLEKEAENRNMVKIAAFYLFTENEPEYAILRLKRLLKLNPEVQFIPVIGIRQFLYLPMIIDRGMFKSKKLWNIMTFIHLINRVTLSVPGVFEVSHFINKKLGLFLKKNKIKKIQDELNQIGVQIPLYADFTPIAIINLDNVIMRWFDTYGKQLDFDYLIFYEFDIYTTKSLESIYNNYIKEYDACFKDYHVMIPNFHSVFPPGASLTIKRLLRQRKLPTTLYQCLFGGNILSRRILEKLQEMDIKFTDLPNVYCEIFMPTISTALGFKCGRLDFPLVRYRPVVSEKEIQSDEDKGIFHPVKSLMSTEKR